MAEDLVVLLSMIEPIPRSSIESIGEEVYMVYGHLHLEKNFVSYGEMKLNIRHNERELPRPYYHFEIGRGNRWGGFSVVHGVFKVRHMLEEHPAIYAIYPLSVIS